MKTVSEVYKILRQIATHHPTVIKIWHGLRRVAESLPGTRFNELEWGFYHIYKPSWAKDYVSSTLSHPHRQMLVEKISMHAPFASVLEIGCASGPNLYLLAKRFPNVRFVGIDINPEAIRQGNLFFKEQSIRNVSLFQGKAYELRFQDRSFDVVFTDAVLIYVGPSKIKKAALEIQRVARKAIILLERHSEQESDLGCHVEKWWLRNYRSLFQPFGGQINTTKIPPEIWGGDWGRFGFIIEVKVPANTEIGSR